MALTVILILYVALNAWGFIYCVLFGFVNSVDPWDVLLYPAIFDHLNLYEWGETWTTIAVIGITIFFLPALFLYFFLLTLLIVGVIAIVAVQTLYEKMRGMRK
jgi:hypothetical protein